MSGFRQIVYRISLGLDWIARLAVFSLMALVVSNVILRFFGIPIRGTMEFVELLTALAVGFSLAYCALQGGHIAVGFLVDRLNTRTQFNISLFTGLLGLFFMLLVGWRLIVYANAIQAAGQMSLTTGMPYSPFIISIAVGFFAYSLVIMAEIIGSYREVRK